MTWETVIGLEIHVQLNTPSKIFSGASTAFGAEPNAHASVVECALPGTLPVMNREVVEKAIKLGLALNAKINQKNVFDRKNYFYPDLLPVIISDAQLQAARSEMPELPKEMAARFVNEFGVSEYDARLLTASRVQAAFFTEAINFVKKKVSPDENIKENNLGKLVANWMNGELAAKLNKEDLDWEKSPITANHLAALIIKIIDGTLNGKLAKKTFEMKWEDELDFAKSSEKLDEQIIQLEKSLEEGNRIYEEIDLLSDVIDELYLLENFIKDHDLVQITDTGAIEAMVDEVLANNAKAVEQFKAGNEKALNAIVGQVMKASKGKANPAQVQELVKAKLG